MNQYDLIVIGAGPGGYVAAIKAAQMNKKVALIEKEKVGGTCLNQGCVPTKTLLHTANLYRELLQGTEIGLPCSGNVHLNDLNVRKNAVIDELRHGIERLIKANSIDYIEGIATITSSSTVQVKEDIYVTDKILIATGSSPAMPPIPGIKLDGVVTSNELLNHPKDYKSLIIIGGGVIGVELASFYNMIGCQVTIIEAMDRILPTLDREISQNLSMILKKRGVTLITGARVTLIEKKELLCCDVTTKSQQLQLCAEGILVATGRNGNIANLGLENVGVRLERGQILVNDFFETTVKDIYSIGDVILGSNSLAHAASAQGINAVSMMFGNSSIHDLSSIPACIYTSPEIACVGITSEDAKTNGIEILQGKAIMSANCKSMIEMVDRGFIKLIFERNTKVILGAQLMCKRATDMIGELTTAIVNKLTSDQLLLGVRPHPTFNEAITAAIEDAFGESIHSMPKRRF